MKRLKINKRYFINYSGGATGIYNGKKDNLYTFSHIEGFHNYSVNKDKTISFSHLHDCFKEMY